MQQWECLSLTAAKEAVISFCLLTRCCTMCWSEISLVPTHHEAKLMGFSWWAVFLHYCTYRLLISERLGFFCDSNLVVLPVQAVALGRVTSFPLPVSWVVASTRIWLLRVTQGIFCSLETICLGEKCSKSSACLWSLWVSLGPWILSTLKVKPHASKTQRIYVFLVSIPVA